MKKTFSVIINNRDLVSWPKQMVENILGLSGVAEILILDNGSSSRDLMRWYKDIEIPVHFLENLGHTAPWESGLVASLNNDLYVVTDPDLDLSELPTDALEQMALVLDEHPRLGKIGLSLRTDDIPDSSPYYNHVLTYEAIIQSRPHPASPLILDAPVDTTFALYDRNHLSSYAVTGARMKPPYCARHLPWYVTEPDEEFSYYLRNAKSKHSSYKSFTGFTDKGPYETLYRNRSIGKVSTKWDSYLPLYDKWLAPFRNDSVNLLEIGVQNGGSLEIWSQYFERAKVLIGCDINPAVANLKYSDERIHVIPHSATTPVAQTTVDTLAPDGFDVIVDDGSHRSLDTISNFLTYFPRLKAGGLYFVEDMHCAYWSEYGGGLFNCRSASTFFKSLADVVNSEHFRGGANLSLLFESFFNDGTVPALFTENSIMSVHFYNSVFIIEKSPPGRSPCLGEVVIVGDDAIVDGRVLAHRK